ncbi:hypothetical protein Hanom_Chr12g01158111 [Helianthus anomalus]
MTKEADDYLRKEVESWEKWFSRLIGERCGRLIVKSEASSEDGNLAEERVAVLVESGKRISDEFLLSWKENKIKIWVEEISGQWVPEFLNRNIKEDEDGSSFFSDIASSKDEEIISDSEVDGSQAGDASPGISPEFGNPKSPAQEYSNGRVRFQSPTCMGKFSPMIIPNVGENMPFNDCEVLESADLDACRNKVGREERENSILEEREDRVKVGPQVNQSEKQFEEGEIYCEFGPNSPRPSYVTLRPNQFKPGKVRGAQEFLTPDLNNVDGK